MAEAITPWLHILAVTVWVGPQFFLFLAAIPAARVIEDMRLRARVTRVIVTRFGWMAWSAMAIIVLTGISNIFQEAADFDNLLNFDYRWVNYFALKMVFVGVMVALTAYHTLRIGPRQLEISERSPDDPQLGKLRRSSMAVSGLVLLLSIVIIYLGALLNNHEFSFQPI